MSLINVLLFDSVEKVGAFAPTGSKNFAIYYIIHISRPTWILVEDNPGHDIAYSLQNFSEYQNCKKMPRKETQGLSLLLVLHRNIIQNIQNTHLKLGEGWAWAWHKSTIACLATFVSVVLLNSIENEGALDPIGSVRIMMNLSMSK